MAPNHHNMIHFRGKLVPCAEANINIMTTTAQYGINVFEGIRVYYNREHDTLYAFRIMEHIERLLHSAKMMRFKLGNGISRAKIINDVFEVIKANKFKEDLYIKIGLFLDGDGSWAGCEPISQYISVTPKSRVFTDIAGVDCRVVSWERINDSSIPPRIKAGANYINSRLAHLEATRDHYHLGIFLDRNGKIAEGTGACILLVRNGKIITPTITSSILESITRETVIEIARNEFHFDVQEREIDRTELYLSDEAFFVGTSVEILPIISVDRMQIGNGAVGEITQLIKEEFYRIVFGGDDKYKKWVMKIE